MRTPAIVFALAVSIVAMPPSFVASAASGANGARASTSGRAAATLEGDVVYVVDGDTIHVRLGDRVEKVRYIGVNAPEIPHPHATAEARAIRHIPHSVAAGEAAKRANLDLASGQRVRLELDRHRRDPYHRLLAYVWAGDTMLNAEIVRRGYAEVMSVPPDFKHRALFVKLQKEACVAGRGLWGAPRRGSPPRCDKLPS